MVKSQSQMMGIQSLELKKEKSQDLEWRLGRTRTLE